jgi:hypothetical protein
LEANLQPHGLVELAFVRTKALRLAAAVLGDVDGAGEDLCGVEGWRDQARQLAEFLAQSLAEFQCCRAG